MQLTCHSHVSLLSYCWSSELLFHIIIIRSYQFKTQALFYYIHDSILCDTLDTIGRSQHFLLLFAIKLANTLKYTMIKGHQRSRTSWSGMEIETLPQNDCNIFISSGTKICKRAIFGILPSFVQRKLRPLSIKQPRLHPTSYLDGLRGVASFIVFMGHYTEENLGWYTEPYGLYEDGAGSSPLQLPIIRVLYSARPMVHIFFIISGFVLAYKPIMQIHSQQYASLITTISSSVFRRALRLFLPSIVTLFVMALAVYSGISDDRYAFQATSLLSQLQHWYSTCWKLLQASWAVNELSYSAPKYNPALWTIPVEFAQSMILFICLIGLSRCPSNVRISLLAAIMIFCLCGGQLFTLEFIGGVLIAEVTLLKEARNSSTSPGQAILPKYTLVDKTPSQPRPTLRQRAVQTFWILNVISGLYISSWTNHHPEDLWGISFLHAHTPSPYSDQKIWFSLAGFQIVIACTQLKFLQDIFNTGVAQYLGNISYALYLTHNLCLTALEPRVVPLLDARFGKDSSMGRHMFWAVGLCIYLPIIIWIADVFWRAVDVPSVKFARWLETRCIVEVAPKKI
jgi:peptidoglycan/LPS O-acetylase OafA/YrhL